MFQTPDFLADMLIREYGEELFSRIESGYRAKRVTSARVNRIKATADEVIASLAAEGIEAKRADFYEDALILSCDDRRAAGCAPFRDGRIYLQSLSSMLPVLYLGMLPGENLLDMAAAPGGKTTQIAAMEPGCFVTACEKNPVRCERLKHNLALQGARRVTVMEKDARKLDPLFVFDRILLDAPCSGSGTLFLDGTKAPDMTRELVDRSVGTQKQLLSCALDRLRPGHELVYSTCSVLREENEEVIRTVLKKAQIVPLTPPEGVTLLPAAIPGTLTVMPDELFEGFFVCKIKKK